MKRNPPAPKSPRRRPKTTRWLTSTILASCALSALAPTLHAESPVPANLPLGYPAWWFQRDVIPRNNPNNATPDYNRPGDYRAPNDYALLTQGQLKTLAVAAYDEITSRAGISAAMVDLVKNWLLTDSQTGSFILDAEGRRQPLTGGTTSDFAPVNLGQLKSVAQPFYQTLVAIGAIPGYPWFNAPNPAEDFAAANLGQAKQLFSFDLTQAEPGDGSGAISNAWLIYYHLTPLNGGGANNDPAADGMTNLAKFQLGLDPTKKNNPAVQLSAYGFAAP